MHRFTTVEKLGEHSVDPIKIPQESEQQRVVRQSPLRSECGRGGPFMSNVDIPRLLNQVIE